MSLETDCGPRRVDSAGRSHIQTVRFVADRISCEKMYQSCSGHGKNPFHWHLQRGGGGGVSWSDWQITYRLSHHPYYYCSLDLPTPPKGRATITLCRMQSLEQKLPLQVSLMNLEITCSVRKATT